MPLVCGRYGRVHLCFTSSPSASAKAPDR
ncbi:Hypothetical protein PFREUD_02410 [Propionibacterium freudenreichii subsp. shermanii CIRM-BIA1]|uniref:Uncharacterized protein n=1 Tax=Propionibacterium freudenreichii subsp. shermanii (strain ATCC 9614 / DSM 4902 / CIP 103027 / NCIMB 8099 / CIRM-BIA1) TaxID=754252 RepID=D7GI39_PROFC|nr:Hypothetical protein PFREUD_02410 [Propionibacterium freudenreichii subsp. shermanii CIRM-BIA1]